MDRVYAEIATSHYIILVNPHPKTGVPKRCAKTPVFSVILIYTDPLKSCNNFGKDGFISTRYN